MTGVLTDPLASLSDEDGIDAAHRLQRHFLRSLLAFIVRFDVAEKWREDGARSMAEWLAYRYDVSRRTAQDWRRVGHALEQLPAIDQAFIDCLISWEKVCLLVQFATPANDAELAHEAPGWSIAYLERVLRDERPITSEEDDATHGARRLRTYWDMNTSMLKIWGRIPGADGAVVAKALDRVIDDHLRAEGDSHEEKRSLEQIRADALIEMCSARLDADFDADRAAVVCHVDASVLVTKHGNGALENGVAVSADVVSMLACDGRLRMVFDGSNGEPVGVGRTMRTVPPWVMQQVRRRDVGCVYPGCGRTAGTHAHHVIPWEEGGPTDLDNLVLVRLSHEPSWRVVNDDGVRGQECERGGLGEFCSPELEEVVAGAH